MSRIWLLLAALTLTASPAAAQLRDTKALTYEAIQNIMSGAEGEAQRNNWRVSIAIVDPGGAVLMVHRLGDAHAGSVDIALGKARTAARFRRATKSLEEAVASRTALLSVEGLVPMEGGVPILVEGQLLGAIGVSGASSAQDEQVATAGLKALKLEVSPDLFLKEQP